MSAFQNSGFQGDAFEAGRSFTLQSVTPGTLALTLTPFTPTVLNPQSATPGTLALVLTPFTPTVLAYHNQSSFQTSWQTDAFQVGWQFSFVGSVPGTLALTLTPFVPTVAIDRTITPGTLALVLTPFVPTVATSNPPVPPVPPSPPPAPYQSGLYSATGGTLVGDYRRHKEQEDEDEEFILAAAWQFFA